MSNLDLIPAPSMALTSEEQVRAYVNPTRIAILAMLGRKS